MKIAVIGAGNVGGTLGAGLAKAGHSVVFGVRDAKKPENAELLDRAGPNATVAAVADAVAQSEVVILSLPFSAAEATLKELGDLDNRVIIDCTNPITADFSGVECEGASAGERIAAWSGSKRVVKCFNTVGFNIMADPTINGRHVTMLYCGDDPGAKSTTAVLAHALGFDPVDAGPLLQAKWLECLAWLWISLAIKYGQGSDMAFCLEKR